MLNARWVHCTGHVRTHACRTVPAATKRTGRAAVPPESTTTSTIPVRPELARNTAGCHIRSCVRHGEAVGACMCTTQTNPDRGKAPHEHVNNRGMVKVWKNKKMGWPRASSSSCLLACTLDRWAAGRPCVRSFVRAARARHAWHAQLSKLAITSSFGTSTSTAAFASSINCTGRRCASGMVRNSLDADMGRLPEPRRVFCTLTTTACWCGTLTTTCTSFQFGDCTRGEARACTHAGRQMAGNTDAFVGRWIQTGTRPTIRSRKQQPRPGNTNECTHGTSGTTLRALEGNRHHLAHAPAANRSPNWPRSRLLVPAETSATPPPQVGEQGRQCLLRLPLRRSYSRRHQCQK